MTTYNVLALDGGGCRGVVTAVLLERLMELEPSFRDCIHLFAGSSIGAANAVSLARSDHDHTTMVEFYTERGEGLFSRRYRPPGLRGKVLGGLAAIPGVGRGVDAAAELIYPKWSSEGLDRELCDYFGTSTTLADLDPKRVLVTSLHLTGHVDDYDADVVLPVGIHNYPSGPHRDVRVHEVLLRSMSAPTFFPSTKDRFVDGGVFANNPSVAALGAAVKLGGARPEDVRLLSIGTGICSDALPGSKPLAWGLLGWGARFPDATLRAVCEFDHLQCEAILGPDRYCRLNAVLPVEAAVDDYRSIPALVDEARAALDSPAFHRAHRFVREHFHT